jgi:hypothetical protein
MTKLERSKCPGFEDYFAAFAAFTCTLTTPRMDSSNPFTPTIID